MHLLLSSLMVSYLNGLLSRELVFWKKRFVKLYCALCLLFGNCEEELPKKPVGRLSVDCRPTVYQKKNCRPTVCRQTANCRPTVCRQTANCRPTVGRLVFWGALLHNYLLFRLLQNFNFWVGTCYT